MKFDEYQTYVHHSSNCDHPHRHDMLTPHSESRCNVPLLSLVKAFIRYLDTANYKEILPTARTPITCKGNMLVSDATAVNVSTVNNPHIAYGAALGACIGLSAEAKGKLGHAVNYERLVKPYIDRIVFNDGFDDIRNVLGQLENKLEAFE